MAVKKATADITNEVNLTNADKEDLRDAIIDGATIKATSGSASSPSLTKLGDTNTGVFFPSNNTLALSTGGSEKVRFLSNGNVGIGETSPGEKLEISDISPVLSLFSIRNNDSFSPSDNLGAIKFKSNDFNWQGDSYAEISTNFNNNLGFAPAINFKISTDSSSAPSTKMTIRANGNVGIGETSPSEKLEVNGNILASGTITENSDERLKENLEPIDSALDKVKQISGYTYTRNDLEDKDKRHLGVIAQDVLKVVPEAVHGSEDTKYSVAYGSLVSVLIEAIKEQDTKIEMLTKRIETLENK